MFGKLFYLLYFRKAAPLIGAGRRRPVDEGDALPVGEWFHSALDSNPDAKLSAPLSLTTLTRHLLSCAPGFVPLSLLAGIGMISAPYFVRQVLVALEQGRAPHALPLVGLLFLFLLVGALSRQHLFDQLQRATTASLAFLRTRLYRKVLRAHTGVYRGESSESVLNMLGDDCRRVSDIFLHGENVIMTPIILFGGIYGLWSLVGFAALSGIAVLIATLIVSYLLGELKNRYRRRALKAADARVDLLDEVLKNILSVKFYSWEKPLVREIESLREKEVDELRVIVLLNAIGPSIHIGAPLVGALVALLLYASSGDALSPSVVFPALAFFSVIRTPLHSIPNYINSWVEARLGVERINAFLAQEEMAGRPEDPTIQTGAIEAADYISQWPDRVRAVGPLSLSISPGELVCIVGRVGSGKSALLRSLLGEVSGVQGKCGIGGDVAYVPQRSWIVNASVRENITFGAAPDDARLQDAVVAASLTHDVQSFPGKLDEEIGERGINLSGGQKQRVSLARADYSESQIVLLDDPLSALDPQVADEVYRNLILKRWSNRTRLLVTHRLEYCRHAHRIFVMDDGKVVAEGTYADLQARNQEFQALSGARAHGGQHEDPHAAPTGAPRISESPDGGTTLVEGEEQYVGSVRKDVYQNYFRRAFPPFVAAWFLFLCAAREGVSIATDMWLAWWSSAPVLVFYLFALGYSFLVLVTIVFTYSRLRLIGDRGLAAVKEYHDGVLSSVMAAPMRFFESSSIGRIVNRFSYDISSVERDVPAWFTDAVSSVLTAASALLLICVLYPKFLLVIPVLLVAHYFLIKDYRPVGRQLGRLGTRVRAPLFAQMSETLSGIEVIRAANQIGRFEGLFREKISLNANVYYTTVVVNRWLGCRTETLSAFVVGSASLIPSIETTTLGPGFAGLVMASAVSIGGAVSWFIRSVTSLESSLNSAERLEHFMGVESERWNGNSPPPRWPERGSIEFKNVSVRYRENSPVILDGLTFSIKPGEKVGIVGRTGGGKSTIFLAIMRILEASQGVIAIGGEDISKLRLEDLRKAISIIPQEPMMLRGTLRRNLDPFGQFSDEEVWSSLRRAHCDAFVKHLDGGLHAVITAHGGNLSVGQRQLIALARSILHRASIVLLDEATANIDPFTDRLVQSTIREEFKGATVVTIAHRVSSLTRYDRIIVIEAGRAVRTGSPSELGGEIGEVVS